MDAFQQAELQKPEDVQMKIMLASALKPLERHQEMVDVLRAAAKLDPQVRVVTVKQRPRLNRLENRNHRGGGLLSKWHHAFVSVRSMLLCVHVIVGSLYFYLAAYRIVDTRKNPSSVSITTWFHHLSAEGVATTAC